MASHLKDAWRTDRLYFRTFCEADYDWMFTAINSDPVNHALANPFPLAPPRRKKPDEWLKLWEGLLNVVICVRTDNAGQQPDQQAGDGEQRIGLLALRYGGYGPSPHNRACELSITLAEASQNRGYGTEAVQWALDWAFRRGNMHSVNLGSVSHNTRAHRCYEKCGFKLAGRRRQCVWHDRKWYDCLDFDILEDEWEALRREKE